MGADEAVLIKDDRKETYDPLRVARVLAAFAKTRQADADLLLFGRMSVGADNAAVPSMVAEILGLPQANVVTKLEIDGSVGHGPAGDRRRGGKSVFQPPGRGFGPERIERAPVRNAQGDHGRQEKNDSRRDLGRARPCRPKRRPRRWRS